MTKSGTFEVEDGLYNQIVRLYDSLYLIRGNDTFEQFCGRMLTEGIITFTSKTLNHMGERLPVGDNDAMKDILRRKLNDKKE